MFSENVSSARLSIFPQDVDLVAAATTITAERATVVDFSYLYWEERLGMLTGTVSGDPFYMFKPLHVYVWICFPGAALVAAIGAACHEVSNVKITVTSKKGFMLPLELMGYILKAMWVQGKFWLPYFLKISSQVWQMLGDSFLWNDKVIFYEEEEDLDKRLTKRGYRGRIDMIRP